MLIDKIFNIFGIRDETLQQGIKYFFVGGICTVLDICVLYCLTEYFHINYLTSSMISFMSGTFLNYFLCTFWVFETRIVQNKYLEFLFYVLITFVGLGLNTLCIWFLSSVLGFYYILSKLFAIAVTYFWNFFGRKYFLHLKN